VADYKWEELNRSGVRRRVCASGSSSGSGSGSGSGGGAELAAAARRVQDVLPSVPLPDIIRDLGNIFTYYILFPETCTTDNKLGCTKRCFFEAMHITALKIR
jgi:hypothetical protein